MRHLIPLGADGQAEVAASLEKFVELDNPTPWGLFLVDDIHDSAESQVARWVERTVFHETFGYTDQDYQDEYGPWEDRSVLAFLVNRPMRTVAATLRVIVGPAGHLKFTNDLDRFWSITWSEACDVHGIKSDEPTIECSTMSAIKSWRVAEGWWPTRAMQGTLIHLGQDIGATQSVQVIDPRLGTLIRSMTGAPLMRFADLPDVDFKGLLEPTVLPFADIRTWFRSTDSEFTDFMLDRADTGRGGVTMPPIELDGLPLAAKVSDRASRALLPKIA